MATAPVKSREELERDAIEASRRNLEGYAQRLREYLAKKAAKERAVIEAQHARHREEGWP